MTIVAVDLAARFSATCVMGFDHRVGIQADSWGRGEAQFIDLITGPWLTTEPPVALIVEDLPHGVKYMTNTKNVCRLQGRIVERMDFYGALKHVLFVPPILWRRAYQGLENGTGPEAVVPVAELLGYSAPDLSHRILKAGDKAIARKVATDYCAAWLIARWAVDHYQDHGTFDAYGTARYGAPPPRRARKPTAGAA